MKEKRCYIIGLFAVILSCVYTMEVFARQICDASSVEHHSSEVEVTGYSVFDSVVSDGVASGDRVASINVNAVDMLTKLFGILDIEMNQEEADTALRECAGLDANVDRYGLWLDPDSGYSLCYCGMRPEVTALAEFDAERATEYTYFFIFPYSANITECECAPGCRCNDCANRAQSAFCGALLQELYDLGSLNGKIVNTDAKFEAVGIYEKLNYNVKLIEDTDRYIVIMDVLPKV